METITGERAELLGALAQERNFLRYTVRDLTDEQAAQRTTASELCLGGLIKHVTATEAMWLRFVAGGAELMQSVTTDRATDFRMVAGDTLAGLLERYEQVAANTTETIATLPDLDASHALPEAPWFEQGARWSARRVLLHLIGETSQHAGHADILRESLDGQKTMG
jgi:uncharacterized damage-inducible protein DinB